MAALEGCALEGLLLVVLTLDPKNAPAELDERYRCLQPRWAMLQKYLTRGWEAGDVPRLGKFKFVSTVEQHRSGTPHMNVIIYSPELAQLLREEPATEAETARGVGPRWWRDLVAHCGWGHRSSIGHARSKSDVASYAVKVEKAAVPHPTLVGEVVKTSQLPTWAPPKTRRIRATKGWLPPARRPTHPDWTGELVQAPTPELQRQAQAEGLAQLGQALGTGLEYPTTAPDLHRSVWAMTTGDEVRILGVKTTPAEVSCVFRTGWYKFACPERLRWADPHRKRTRWDAYAPLTDEARAWVRARAAEWVEAPPPRVLTLDELVDVERFRRAAKAALTVQEIHRAWENRPADDVMDAWHAMLDRAEKPEAPEVDDGGRPAEQWEPPRSAADVERFKFGAELTARFEFWQDVAEASARGEDVARIEAPTNWRIRKPARGRSA
ncbi:MULTISPECIES: hypothetical protein [unclassified Corallococcus]|uniref:hypothetical protein n=1 Tax=unclassified Corallococcus TaxID=2685029 RepID=UPI001A8CA136|nr:MULTISPECIES: hypothetical protein [unclassified Corallococcus]MBN9685384.1 hypothetical protein [Corallococcus sp. NCSPR001]WAS83165.1 hypothetical protein O0N60_28070 [Corallococcus sp. NCRR]